MNAEVNNVWQDPEGTAPITSLVARRTMPAVARPARPCPRLLIAHDPYDPRCEKIRALRTELLLRRDGAGPGETIALLSPGSGDGRSLLAAELAISFAQLGRPTLLVDADLRYPSQHLLFEAGNQIGLVQAIERGDAPHLHAVDGLPQLSVLTAGPAPDNPLELLLNSRFAQLIEEWRNTFDFVIVDTAPATVYSDGLAVASLVRRVLTLARAKRTSYKANREMLQRLAAIRAHVIGAVINHF